MPLRKQKRKRVVQQYAPYGQEDIQETDSLPTRWEIIVTRIRQNESLTTEQALSLMALVIFVFSLPYMLVSDPWGDMFSFVSQAVLVWIFHKLGARVFAVIFYILAMMNLFVVFARVF